VTIGGIELPAADVFFAGLTPGLVGLLQVNAKVPAAAPTGDDVAVVIRIAGAESQTGAHLSVR
jgi:uncharacterized protein (TIGR03437 family)